MRKCTECGSSDMESKVGTHEADFGLDAPVLVEGAEILHCRACGETAVSIPRMAELVDAVTRKLVLKSERLTSKEIVYLRKQLQLTQTELADHLGGVGQVTVSRWETGDQAMRAPAERLLRVLAYAHVQGVGEMIENVAKSANASPSAARAATPLHARDLNGHWDWAA
jgi:putative zinc finger/helix-turn-helix YgiT family protein